MEPFKIIRNADGTISHIETGLQGYDLLNSSKLNKGCAFPENERKTFHLEGLLPHYIESLELQVARMYAQFNEHRTNLSKNIYLNVLHDYNETLFYKLVSSYIEEMLPIIYTPTVGEAVERFSLEHRKTRGIYLGYPDLNQIEKIIDNRFSPEVDLIVVTDGEAVLGIGDQGIGGIKISSAKLMVYTLCGGINPHRVLPIQLDVGTNNPYLLADPMYLGWRHERISGQAYDDFIDLFVQTIKKKLPHVFLHWEDLGRDNARRILNRYHDQLCTFNGDIQGTGTVALACILTASIASGIRLADQRIVIFGAGTAGVGIADQICEALQRQGLTEQEARKRFWLVDKQGLLLNDTPNLLPFQTPYLHSREEISHWKFSDPSFTSLADVVKNVKPTILIGSSAVPFAFTEEIIRTMAEHNERPVIMPLSNPNTRVEALPEDIIKWTEGRAIIATGSPFPNILYNGLDIRIAQSNNAFAFPGIGLGTIAVKAKKISKDMLWAATQALSQCSPIIKSSTEALLPTIKDAKEVSYTVALAVAKQARAEGLAQIPPKMDLEYALKSAIWEPKYYPYRKI